MLAPPPLPRTLAAALRDVSSEKPQSRASAIADLARHALASEETRKTAVPIFEKALRDEVNVVRSAAAIALADVKGVEALAALLVAVEDADAYVRQMALNALGEIGDSRARARIERALADERNEVRYQAVIAFTRVAKDDVEAVAKALLRAVGDADDAIRYIALRLVEDHALWTREDIAAAAKTQMEDSHASVALAAAIVLSRAGDTAAKAKILAVVRDGARDAERIDEQAAVELAGELGWKEATADLERRAWGVGRFMRDTSAWNAKIALAALGHAKAKAEILEDLSAWRRDARQAAVVAAGRARLAEARAKIESLRGDVDEELLVEALAKLPARAT